jgi:hypothetical protein
MIASSISWVFDMGPVCILSISMGVDEWPGGDLKPKSETARSTRYPTAQASLCTGYVRQKHESDIGNLIERPTSFRGSTSTMKYPSSGKSKGPLQRAYRGATLGLTVFLAAMDG